MSELKYVDEVSASNAKEMELKLQSLPPSAGVLFVSVTADPILGGRSNTYNVRVGMKRSLGIGAGLALVKHTLRHQIASGLNINAAIYEGVSGAAHESNNEDSGHITA